MNLRVAPVSLRLHVRPADLDGVGHVNNSVVLQYLEAGRWAWMDHHDLRRTDSVVAVVPVVSRIDVHYLREIPYGELDVSTAMVHQTEGAPSDVQVIDVDDLTYRVTFRQEVILVRGGGVAARANVSVAFIDKDTRRLCTVQDFVRASVSA